MPFALVTIGLLLFVTGAKDTYKALGAQVASDFTGPGNFTYWLAAIGAMGALGYIEAFKPFSRAFMVLIIVSMVLANQGFFAKLTAAIKSGPDKSPVADPVASANPSVGPIPVANVGTASNQGSGDLAKVAMTAAEFAMLA